MWVVFKSNCGDGGFVNLVIFSCSLLFCGVFGKFLLWFVGFYCLLMV